MTKTLQNGAHGKGVKCLGYGELHSVGSLVLIFMSSPWNTDLAEASSQQFKTSTGYSRAFVDKIKYNKDVLPYFGPQMG